MQRSDSTRGSAIILVLWCLVVLGIAIFGVVELVELSAENTSRDELALQARALAMSGVALGLSPQISKDDPLLDQQPADNHSFKVRIESEGSRLNLNYVLLSGIAKFSRIFSRSGGCRRTRPIVPLIVFTTGSLPAT